MKLGLIGVQHSGKSTIFKALTSFSFNSSCSATRNTPNRMFVPVSDHRIDELSKIYQPRKTTYASIELFDFPDFFNNNPDGNGNSGQIQQEVRHTDGLAVVLRNFTNELLEQAEPEKELNKIESELMLIDLISVEKRLERISWSRQRGKMTMTMEREERILNSAIAALNDSIPIRRMVLTREEEQLIRGFQFLSQKEIMVILNSDESSFGQDQELMERLNQQYNVVEFAGSFEMELVELESDEERQMFMQDMGITTSARERLSRMAYQTLGLISFFTVGSDEVKAWTIHNGDTALEAARTIHSDLARGFIRASCFNWHDLTSLGSEKLIREKGLFKLEGKDHIV